MNVYLSIDKYHRVVHEAVAGYREPVILCMGEPLACRWYEQTDKPVTCKRCLKRKGD